MKCPEGLVYKECFNRACDISCSDLMVEDVCPLTQECFPGCYCPDGLVKDGEKCVTPPECRDCELKKPKKDVNISWKKLSMLY